MKSALNFLYLFFLDLELTFQALLLDMLVKNCGWVALNVIQIYIKSLRQVRPAPMLNVLVIEAILETVIEHDEEQCDIDDARNHKLLPEVFLAVAARPKETLVELSQLLGSLGVKFIKDRLVERIDLQRAQLEIFVHEQLALNDVLSGALSRPDVYHVILAIVCVL